MYKFTFLAQLVIGTKLENGENVVYGNKVTSEALCLVLIREVRQKEKNNGNYNSKR